MINPWFIVIALLVLAGTATGSYLKGGRDTRNAIEAQQAHDDKLVQQVTDSVNKATATAIANIEVKHVTIKQQLETQIRDNPVYRDCVADDSVFKLTNQALTGRAQPISDKQLPGAAGDDGKGIR